MGKMKQLSLFFLLILISQVVRSQVLITGKVVLKDEGGIAIPGVSIIEKETSNRVLTDGDGTFKISVKDKNAILVFEAVGHIKKEVLVKGQEEIVVELKIDCIKHFFDSSKILFYINSGLINNPLGGQIEINSPFISGGVIKGLFSYQTNLDKNKYKNGQIELSHFISNCDLDIDFKWNYRQVAFDDKLNIKANSFEADLNINNVKLIGGYTYLNFDKVEANNSYGSGVVMGFGTYLKWPIYSTLIGKISFYRNKIEYQASIQSGYRGFLCFVRFYKLDMFNELSLGIGTAISYRTKKKWR